MDHSLFHGDLVTSKRILYTPSAFARTSLLHLQEIGALDAQKPHTSSRAGLDSYLFFLVKEGSGTLTYRDVRHTLHKGDCVFLDCRNEYAHRTDDSLWSLCWLHFNGPTMGSIYAKYEERGGKVVFHADDTSDILQIWQQLFELTSSDDYIRDMRINEGLASLTTLLMANSWHPESVVRHTGKRSNLQQVKVYLAAHYTEQISLDTIAQQFYISKYYLAHKYKEQFGITILEDILQMRISKAKQLLRFSDESVEQISEICGFGDANYFARVFKRVEGSAPGEYRKRWG